MSKGRRTEPDLQDVIEGAIEDLRYSFNCHRIGTIESFNPTTQRASIKMVDKGVTLTTDGEVLVSYSLLTDCPVVINKSAKGGVTFPINSGDTCLICFNDRDLDNWLEDGQTQRPNTLRTHDFSDAIAIVGVRSTINQITDFNNNATEINYEDSKISLDGSSISLDSAEITLSSTAGGSIKIDDKLELKNTAENLKLIVDTLLTIITNLKAVDNPSSPTITLVIDQATTNALTALSTRVSNLLK